MSEISVHRQPSAVVCPGYLQKVIESEVGQVDLLGPGRVSSTVHLRRQSVVVAQTMAGPADHSIALRAPGLLCGSSAIPDGVDVTCTHGANL